METTEIFYVNINFKIGKKARKHKMVLYILFFPPLIP